MADHLQYRSNPATQTYRNLMTHDVVETSGKDGMSTLRWITLSVVLMTMMVLAGCAQRDVLVGPQPVHRAVFLDKILPVPSHTSNSYLIGYSSPAAVSPAPRPRAGTFTFVVPPGVTQFEKQTRLTHEYLLYMGRPAPDQKPFVTLIVAHGVVPVSKNNAAMRVKSSRLFLLNGLPAQEWTGHTTTGAGFAEIVVRSPDQGGELDAMAISSTPTTRKLALAVLKSIHWQASKSAGDSEP